MNFEQQYLALLHYQYMVGEAELSSNLLIAA